MDFSSFFSRSGAMGDIVFAAISSRKNKKKPRFCMYVDSIGNYTPAEFRPHAHVIFNKTERFRTVEKLIRYTDGMQGCHEPAAIIIVDVSSSGTQDVDV